MRILYVSQLYTPENVAGAFRASQHSQIWTTDGETVTVFTAYPNFPTGRVIEGYQPKLFSTEQIDGVRVIRNKIIVRPNTNIFNRLISYLSFTIFALLNMVIHRREIGKHDIVLGTIGPVFSGVVAYAFAKMLRVPLVLEFRDITFQQMLAVGKGRRRSVRVMRWLELFLCSKASKVVTVTQGFRDVLVECGVPHDKIEVIPNGVLVNNQVTTSEYTETETASVVKFVYLGTIGESQNLDRTIELIETASTNCSVPYELTIVGAGAKQEEVSKLIQDRNIGNHVKIIGPVPKNHLEQYYNQSDVSIVSLKNTESFSETIPSKIFDVMLHQHPMLFVGPEGEATKIIQDSNCGFCATDTHDETCVQIIVDVLRRATCPNGRNELKTMGASGYSYVLEHYNRLNLARKYRSVFSDVLRAGKMVKVNQGFDIPN